MWKQVILLLCFISLCLAEGEVEARGRKRPIYKHKYLYHSGVLYYLAFLAIKVKIVFLIGTFVTLVVFATKIFALIKYGTFYLIEKKKEEKTVYVQPDHHHYEHFDHQPYYSGPGSDIYSEYGEKVGAAPGPTSRDLGDDIFENFDTFKNIIKELNLTDMAFEDMSLGTTSCRKRFVCEADFRARDSTALALGMYIFSDNALNKYRTKNPISKFEDCASLYRDCNEMDEHDEQDEQVEQDEQAEQDEQVERDEQVEQADKDEQVEQLVKHR